MNPMLKKLILGFFLIALSVLFWLFVKQLFFQDPTRIAEHFWSFRNLGIFSTLLILYGTALGLTAFLVTQRGWAHGMLFLGIAPYFFASPSHSYELVGAFVILWASLFAAREWIAKENANRITLAIEKTVPGNLSLALTAIAFAVSVVFYTSPAVVQFKDIRIPRGLFQKMIAPFENLFWQQASVTAQSFTGTPQNAVPAGPVESVKPEERALLKDLARPFSEAPSAKSAYSEFSDALYNALNAQIARVESLSPAVQRILAISTSLGLFAVIRLLIIPVGWVIIIFSMIIFNVLTYAGFIKIGTKTVEKETIEL